jgi:hypothetical protein
MAYVLAVTACKVGDPVAVLVLVKRDDRLLFHLSSRRTCGHAMPSVLRG